jgi:hypothetical protein
MSLLADLRRRLDLCALPVRLVSRALAGSPGRDRPAAPSRREVPRGRREPHGIPGIHRHAFLAIAEALQDGTDVVPPSSEVGRRLAEDGVSLPEALDGLRATYCSVVGGDPAFHAVRALSLSWSESALTYLNSLSCEDPLTGLSSLAHLRSRLGEIYREAELQGECVSVTHALVVVEPALATAASPVDRELRLVDVGECLRIVFNGGEVLARVGIRRAAALVRRTAELPARVDTVRVLITQWRVDDGPQPARVWIEGLPTLSDWSGRILDELARP